MGIQKILSLSALAFLTISCASTPPESEPVEQVYVPTFKTMSHKGFNLVVPDDASWKVANENEYKVELAKRGEVSNEVYTIQALLVKLPSFETDDEFMSFIQSSMDANNQASETQVIEQGASFIPYNDNQCVQVNRKTEKQSTSSPMVLEIVNFTCRHPFKDDAGVYLAYAKRYQSDSIKEDLVPQALNLFYNLEFTEL
jgi:hypothetical protein